VTSTIRKETRVSV